jgi:peptidyl-prolyl cis-trans isomerase D
MTILERLRKRSGLLVGIVGLALLAFVLTGLLERGGSLFSGGSNSIGEINGKSIDKPAFDIKVKEAEENQKKQSGKTTLTSDEMDQVVATQWNQTINEEVMDKEYAKLGISVSDDELNDLMTEHPHQALVRNLSDQQGKLSPMFADPQTGQVSPKKIKEFIAKMTDQQEGEWTKLEEYIRKVRTVEKYNNLIKKGLYVPAAFAKKDYIAQNSNSTIKYVFKSYKAIADSTIKPTDAELQKYYNEHQNEFKQEASRKFEYVTYDIAPSQEDIDNATKNMAKLADEFKSKKVSEDSSFVVAEADSRNFDMQWHTTGTLSPQINDQMFSAEVGTVVGPYNENGVLKISKLEAEKNSADSAHVRHILITYKGADRAPGNVTRTKEQAKSLADSIKTLLKTKKGKFEDLVAKYSEDPGKNTPADAKDPKKFVMGRNGDYGWLNAKSGFVEPFKDAGLDNKKGDIVVAEAQFGFHIIEVLDTKGSQKKVRVSTIDSKVSASAKTMQSIFVIANKFAGENNTNDLFQKAVAANKMNKRVADNIKESDKTINGIEGAKPLIRWIYENKKGMVFPEAEQYGEKYIVGVITEVKEKGIATFEQAKDELTAKVIKEKKAEKYIAEFDEAVKGGGAIDAMATKLKLPMTQQPNINFGSAGVPDAPNEHALIGTVAGLKPNVVSKPIKGNDGVMIVVVESRTDAPAQKDYKAQQTQQASAMQSRVDYEVYDALKKAANVTDHLIRFY